MSTQAGLLVEARDVLLTAGELADGAAAYLQRMKLAETPVIVLDPHHDSADVQQHMSSQCPDLPLFGNLADAPASWQPPRPGMLSQAMQQHSINPFTSWLITKTPALVQAAASAGLLGVVWIGDDAPTAPPGLTLNCARDFADAPRVMVPPNGGCWHDHG